MSMSIGEPIWTAGPEGMAQRREDPPRDWRDAIEDAADALRTADRTFRDCTSVQHKLRREQLEAAAEFVAEALAKLPKDYGTDARAAGRAEYLRVTA